MIKKQKIKFIDLGLPSGNLWSFCNFGSAGLYNPGIYYQWGGISGKRKVFRTKSEEYNSYRFMKNYKITKYNEIDNLTELQPEDDIVTMTLGKNYKIPSEKDFEELMNHITLRIEGKRGIFLSNNHGSIYFPFEEFDLGRKYCCCWANDLYYSEFDAYLFRLFLMPGSDKIDYYISSDVSKKYYSQIRPIKTP